MNNRFLVALFGLGLLMGTARGQTFTSYDYPGAYTTGLGKITAAGDVFGGYNNGPDNCCTYIGRHSFLLIGGLAGTAVSVDVTQAEVSGNQSTLLVAVNPGFLVNGPNDYSGQIGGQYTDSGNNVHGWLRTYAGTSSSFVTIDPPGSVYTRVTGVNDRGDVVGAFTVPGTQHGFLLRKGAYQTIDFPGATYLTRWD